MRIIFASRFQFLYTLYPSLCQRIYATYNPAHDIHRESPRLGNDGAGRPWVCFLIENSVIRMTNQTPLLRLSMRAGGDRKHETLIARISHARCEFSSQQHTNNRISNEKSLQVINTGRKTVQWLLKHPSPNLR